MCQKQEIKKRRLALILKKAALNQNLKAKEYRLLLFLMPELRKGEAVKVSQAEISRQTGMTPSQVSKAMKNLFREDILSDETDGTSWRKEIRLIAEDLNELKDDIDRIIAENTGDFFDDDDDDDDDE